MTPAGGERTGAYRLISHGRNKCESLGAEQFPPFTRFVYGGNIWCYVEKWKRIQSRFPWVSAAKRSIWSGMRFTGSGINAGGV